MKKIIIPVVIAALLWFVMFSPWTSGYVNFWITMGFSALFLAVMAALLTDNFRNQFSFTGVDLLLGLVSAAVLY